MSLVEVLVVVGLVGLAGLVGSAVLEMAQKTFRLQTTKVAVNEGLQLALLAAQQEGLCNDPGDRSSGLFRVSSPGATDYQPLNVALVPGVRFSTPVDVMRIGGTSGGQTVLQVGERLEGNKDNANNSTHARVTEMRLEEIDPDATFRLSYSGGRQWFGQLVITTQSLGAGMGGQMVTGRTVIPLKVAINNSGRITGCGTSSVPKIPPNCPPPSVPPSPTSAADYCGSPPYVPPTDKTMKDLCEKLGAGNYNWKSDLKSCQRKESRALRVCGSAKYPGEYLRGIRRDGGIVCANR